MAKPPERFLPDMVGFFRSLAYDFETKVGRADLTPGSHSDRISMIGIFQAIDLEVRRIEVLTNGLEEVFHVRTSNGHWRTYLTARYRDELTAPVPAACTI
jgi:hypothetical protein